MKLNKSNIYQSLQAQLAKKGTPLDHFEDLLVDYMTFWETKNKLKKDIKNRGVAYKDLSAAGKEMWKNNPSISSLIDINKQMLAILDKLGLSTEDMGGGDTDVL